MKYWKGETTYNFTWTQVVQGFWSRYPNPNSHHVLTEDILETSIIDGRLYVKKMLTKKGKVPSYLEKFTGGVSDIRLIEETFVDLETRTLETYTRNIDMQNVMSVHEKCFYTGFEADTSTLCTREVFSSSSVPHFGGIISSFSVQQYRKNIDSTTKGFNYVLTKMFKLDSSASDLAEKDSLNKQNFFVKFIKTIHLKVKIMIFGYTNKRLVCCPTYMWIFHPYIKDFV